MTVYLPSNSLESLLDTVVSNASSDDDVSRSDVTLNDSHIDSYNPPSSSSTPSKQSSSSFSSSPSPSPSPSPSASASASSSVSPLAFAICNEILTIKFSFKYLSDYFKCSLSSKNKPLNLDKILDDICSYAFVQLKVSIDVCALRNELSRQIGHILQSARSRASGKGIMNSLRMTSSFSLIFKSIKSLKQVSTLLGYQQYRADDSLSPILLFQMSKQQEHLLHFYPHSRSVDVTFNDVWIKNALSSFDLFGEIDVDELSNVIHGCSLTLNVDLDAENIVETLKTEILSCRSSLFFTSFTHCDFQNREKRS